MRNNRNNNRMSINFLSCLYMDTLRGIFPKRNATPKRDFIKENVRRVKETATSRKNLAINGSSRASSIKPTVSINLHQTNDEVIVIKKRSETFINGCSPATVVSTTREMSSQTGDINDDLFLKDVIIRIPSAKVLDELKRTKDNNENGSGKRTVSNQQQQQAAVKRGQRKQDSPVYEEHKSIATGSSRSNRCANGIPSSSAGSSCIATSKMGIPSSYRVGKLPKYLQEMNEHKEEQRRVEAEIDPNCPEAHVALSESERIEALEIANQSFQHLIDELNRMPLTSQTLKIKHRKMEIEKELNEIEENIRIFSRQKVYVKIDE